MPRHARAVEARPLRRPLIVGLVVVVVAVAVLLLGLRVVHGSEPHPVPEAVFHVQKGVQPGAAAQPCLLHQTDQPTAGFRGGGQSVPLLELPFLAYYTANGNKAFCDGRPASDVDKAWARLYVRLTGNRAAVGGILSR